EHTAAHTWPTRTTRLTTVLIRHLHGGYFADALTSHGHARDAARHAGDPTAEAHALNGLGNRSPADRPVRGRRRPSPAGPDPVPAGRGSGRPGPCADQPRRHRGAAGPLPSGPR